MCPAEGFLTQFQTRHQSLPELVHRHLLSFWVPSPVLGVIRGQKNINIISQYTFPKHILMLSGQDIIPNLNLPINWRKWHEHKCTFR